jgi:hypothetical protein
MGRNASEQMGWKVNTLMWRIRLFWLLEMLRNLQNIFQVARRHFRNLQCNLCLIGGCAAAEIHKSQSSHSLDMFL